MSIVYASRSDKGLVREVNEDNLAVLADLGLAILADGMGGYIAGEMASQIAVETIASTLLPVVGGEGEPEETEAGIRASVTAANQAIFSQARKKPEYGGMATTFVLGLFVDGCLRYAHLGDSRIYRLRGGTFTQLTRDHSMIQELVDQGYFRSIQEAEDAGVNSNVLTMGLGIDEVVEADQDQAWIEPEDLFLFCSDGLSNMVPDQEMARLVGECLPDLDAAADSLLQRALENGGKDNISLVLVRPEGIG